MVGVANYTPIYIKIGDEIIISKIESLVKNYANNEWKIYRKYGIVEYEFCDIDHIETWSDNGWTKIKSVIRRPFISEDIFGKNQIPRTMMRIVTNNGLIDITNNRPILNIFGEKILPVDLNMGDNLLHYIFDENVKTRHNNDTNYIYVNCEDMIDATKYMLCLPGKYDYEINNLRDSNIININRIKKEENANPHDIYSIKQMYNILYRNDYVYDLITENGNYAAGVGNIII